MRFSISSYFQNYFTICFFYNSIHVQGASFKRNSDGMLTHPMNLFLRFSVFSFVIQLAKVIPISKLGDPSSIEIE